MKKIKIGNSILKVSIAKSATDRRKGLMNQSNLSEDAGMLFCFPKEEKLSFWMKNTRIPLSIAFISKSGKILEIKDLEPFNEESVSSSIPAMYALEVNKGWFENNNIKKGDQTTGLPIKSIKIRIS